MKKVFALFIICAAAISMTACSKDKEPTAKAGAMVKTVATGEIIIDENGAARVGTQQELEAALAMDNVTEIRIESEAAGEFTIPDGVYDKVVTVNAPNSGVRCEGYVRGLQIEAVSANNFYIVGDADAEVRSQKLEERKQSFDMEVVLAATCSKSVKINVVNTVLDNVKCLWSAGDTDNVLDIVLENAFVANIEIESYAQVNLTGTAIAQRTEYETKTYSESVAVKVSSTPAEKTGEVVIKSDVKVDVEIKSDAAVKVQLSGKADGSVVKDLAQSATVDIENATATAVKVVGSDSKEVEVTNGAVYHNDSTQGATITDSTGNVSVPVPVTTTIGTTDPAKATDPAPVVVPEGYVPCPDCANKTHSGCDNGHTKDCPVCHGTYYICIKCHGVGLAYCEQCLGQGHYACAACTGTGKVNGRTCAYCEGTGSQACLYCNATGDVTCNYCVGTGRGKENKGTGTYCTAEPNCPHCSGCATCGGTKVVPAQ